jgi:hypothetical protein
VYFLALVMTFLFNKRLISSLANTSLKNISLRFSSSFDFQSDTTITPTQKQLSKQGVGLEQEQQDSELKGIICVQQRG